MTTPTRTEESLRRMLERRAERPPPPWILPSVAQTVRATQQARPGGRASWFPRRRNERLVLVAASAALLLAVVLGALAAGGLVNPAPKPGLLPADVVAPSLSATGSPGISSASPSGTLAPPGPGNTTPPGAAAAGSVWALPTGWRYELECDDDGSGCGLSLYDEAGRVQDGWPVRVPGDCWGSDVAVGPEDSAFLVCERDARAVVTGLDRTGNALPGWPVKLKGRVAWSTWNDFRVLNGWPEVEVGPDATVYVAAAPKGEGSYAIHALAPDGQERTGWPVALAGDAQGFAVASSGTVIAWWYEGFEEGIELRARRTVFTEMDQDGQIRPGWPKGSVGAASGPVVREDGSIFYVSESGKVWGHDPSGRIIEGWPYELAYPIAPRLRPDGTFMFIEASRVVVLDEHGETVGGWPYRTKGTFIAPGCDTPGFPDTLDVLAEDGTLYLSSWDETRSSVVVALRPDGSMADGWPYRVAAGWRVGDLSMARDDGSLHAWVASAYCGESGDARSIKLSAQGKLLGEPLPTPLSHVYEALRLDGLRTSSGNDTFIQGAQIDFEVDLVNRSDGTIELPHVDYGGGSWYAAGALQTWIRPRTDGPPPSCLSDDEEDDWFATGGEIVASFDRVRIQPGAGMPSPLEASLPPAVTGCLAPGDYRFRVDYTQLNDVGEDALHRVTLDFSITASGPVAIPTPRPTPTPAARPTPTPALTPPPDPTTPRPS